MKNWGHIVRKDLMTRMREARAKPMRDHEKLGPYSKLRTL